MNFRSTLHLLLFAFTSSSSAKLYDYEVDNNDNVRSLKGAAAAAAAANADADEEHRNLEKAEAAKKIVREAAATSLTSSKTNTAPVIKARVAGQASTLITAFEIFEAAAELAAKLEQACCVSCNQGTSTSNICAGLFELECTSPIAQVIGDCLEKLCTCEFRQCALERLVTELCENPDLVFAAMDDWSLDATSDAWWNL